MNQRPDSPIDAFLGECETQLLRNPIFRERLPMAVAAALRAFDLRIEAQGGKPLHPSYQRFIANPAALGILLSAILRHCQGPLAISEARRLRGGTLQIINKGLDRDASDAITLATVRAEALALRDVDFVEWDVRGRSASARLMRGRELDFKRTSLASLQWDYMNYAAIPYLRHLASLALTHARQDRDSRERLVDVALSMQTDNLAMPSQSLTAYSIDEWSILLRRLLGSALATLAAVVGAQTAALIWDANTTSWVAEHGVPLPAVDAAIDELTFAPSGTKSDPVASPLVPVGAGVLLSSPYLVLLRRADIVLLRQWHATSPSRFSGISYVPRVHERLSDLLRSAGLEAEHDVKYKDLVGVDRDVDVLVTEPPDRVLVIQVKAVLPPKRFLGSIQSREQEITYGFVQVANALETIDADPRRVIRSGSLLGKRHLKSFGIVTPTYGVGIPVRLRFPVIDLPRLKSFLLERSGGSITIRELLVLASQSPVERLAITEVSMSAGSFRVLLPFLDYSGITLPVWARVVQAWVSKMISRLVYWSSGRVPRTT